MNNIDLSLLEQNNQEILKKYGLDSESIDETKNKIKKVSEEEKQELGKQLYELITKKGYNDETEYEQALELIYNGADVEYCINKKGNFPLLVCAIHNYFKTFVVLLKAGANVNQTNNYLTTAAFSSARHGHKEMLEILILMKADVNAKCLDGDTAIMSAKRHNMTECFDMLVKANAYLNHKNLTDESVLDIPSKVEFDLSMFPEYLKEDAKEKEIQTTEKDVQNLLNEALNKMNSINSLEEDNKVNQKNIPLWQRSHFDKSKSMIKK